MRREYIKIPKASPKLIPFSEQLKEIDDNTWKNEIFRHLLLFYKTYDIKLLSDKIKTEKSEKNPRVERLIAKFIRLSLNKNEDFNFHFKAFGEVTNDEEIEGNYDIVIHSTNWRSKDFCFECKNLDKSQDLVNKYVYYNTGHETFDGGVYRFFNGKYAQQQDFGGMIGFVLEGEISEIKNKITDKLKEKFDVTPEGDLIKIIDKSIENNDFTFDSIHNRFSKNFILHHILLQLN